MFQSPIGNALVQRGVAAALVHVSRGDLALRVGNQPELNGFLTLKGEPGSVRGGGLPVLGFDFGLLVGRGLLLFLLGLGERVGTARPRDLLGAGAGGRGGENGGRRGDREDYGQGVVDWFSWVVVT